MLALEIMHRLPIQISDIKTNKQNILEKFNKTNKYKHFSIFLILYSYIDSWCLVLYFFAFLLLELSSSTNVMVYFSLLLWSAVLLSSDNTK